MLFVGDPTLVTGHYCNCGYLSCEKKQKKQKKQKKKTLIVFHFMHFREVPSMFKLLTGLISDLTVVSIAFKHTHIHTQGENI